MNGINTLAGLVQVELTSADLPGALDALARDHIRFYNIVQQSDLSMGFQVQRADYRKLKELCSKRGDRLRLLHTVGVYWQIKGLLKRPVLIAGIFLFLIAALYLPTRVFFVEVEGNSDLPANRILEAAAECGIGFGASRREVRSEKLKNALLDALPELQWAGVNTYGCVARITVRERAVSQAGEPGRFGSIVAIRDGVITDCTATKGNLLCAVGQAVSQGQVLISGYTDCGICIRAEAAEGEVYARTRRNLEVLLPANHLCKQEPGETAWKISLLIGKKRINLWKDSGIWDTTCDRMYEEYYVTLPGGFRLPVALVVETFILRPTAESSEPRADAEDLLKRFGRSYLTGMMIAGQIKSDNAEFISQDGAVRMTGEYDCIEMIGKIQQEQMGEYNGEDS